MTNEEKQSIVSEVLASLQTNSKKIEDLTEVTTLPSDGYVEVSGGKKISGANLNAPAATAQSTANGAVTVANEAKSTAQTAKSSADAAASAVSEVENLATAAMGTASQASSNITALSRRVQTAEQSVSGHTTAIEALQSDIEEMQEDIEALETTAGNAASGVTTLSDRLNTVSGNVNANKGDITSLKARMSTAESTLAATKQKADQSASSITVIGATLASHAGDIEQLQEDVETAAAIATEGRTKANNAQSTINTLTSTLQSQIVTTTDHGNDISLMKARISATEGVANYSKTHVDSLSGMMFGGVIDASNQDPDPCDAVVVPELVTCPTYFLVHGTGTLPYHDCYDRNIKVSGEQLFAVYISDVSNKTNSGFQVAEKKVVYKLSLNVDEEVIKEIINAEVEDILEDQLSNKVDKVAGKGLSTNDYTTDEKTKLAGIAEGAEVNVQADWNETDSEKDSFIKNKPSLFSGSYNDLTNKPTIPTIPASLPANGGNADTVDNKHASDFATANHNHDSAYASASHNHDAAYAAEAHTHSQYLTSQDISGKADIPTYTTLTGVMPTSLTDNTTYDVRNATGELVIPGAPASNLMGVCINIYPTGSGATLKLKEDVAYDWINKPSGTMEAGKVYTVSCLNKVFNYAETTHELTSSSTTE